MTEKSKHEIEREHFDLANSLLFDASLRFPGETDLATSIQWGFASLRFHALTGKTLTSFYAGVHI